MKQLLPGLAIVISALSLSCGGSSNTSQSVNGCSTFTDATAAGASRTVNFSGSLGNNYDPKCLAVAAGQQVTFSGNFAAHPMNPGVAPSQGGSGGSPNNPIQSMASGTNAAFTFATAGTYPYYCTLHQGVGMFGAIQVR